MCYKSERNCFITRLYETMEVNRERGLCMTCTRPELEKPKTEIDLICSGKSCLKRLVPCDTDEDGNPKDCLKNEGLPCLPPPICIQKIYNECRNDPEAGELVRHLMNKMKRHEADELAWAMRNKYFTKEFVQEIESFYKQTAAVPPKRVKKVVQPPEDPYAAIKAAYSQISAEELQELEKEMRAKRREAQLRADEAAARAAEEAAAEAAMAAEEEEDQDPEAAAAAARRAALKAGTPFVVKAGSKEAKEIAAGGNPRARPDTFSRNKDNTGDNVYIEPWLARHYGFVSIRNILPTDIKGRIALNRDHRSSPWPWKICTCERDVLGLTCMHSCCNDA